MDIWFKRNIRELCSAAADESREEKQGLEIDTYDILIYRIYGSFIDRERVLDMPYTLFFYEAVEKMRERQEKIESGKKYLEDMRRKR